MFPMTTQAMDLVKRNVKLHLSTSSSLYHTRQRLCRMHLNAGDEGGSGKVCKRKRRSQGTRRKFFQALPDALYIIKQRRKELSRRSSSESLSVTKGTKTKNHSSFLWWLFSLGYHWSKSVTRQNFFICRPTKNVLQQLIATYAKFGAGEANRVNILFRIPKTSS